jgi:hypothetical protein
MSEGGAVTHAAYLRSCRYERFAARQQVKKPRFVRLSVLAFHHARAHCLDKDGADLIQWIVRAYSLLRGDINSGFFMGPRQRLQLLHLHPSTPPYRMTPERLSVGLGSLQVDSLSDRLTLDANFVGCLWTTGKKAAAWCDDHDLAPLQGRRGRPLIDDSAVLSLAREYQRRDLPDPLRLAMAQCGISVPNAEAMRPNSTSWTQTGKTDWERLRRKFRA